MRQADWEVKMTKTNKLKVFLGPTDYAGLMWGYKKCLNSIGVCAKLIIYNEHRYEYSSDVNFELKKNKLIRALGKFYHFPKLLYCYNVFHFVGGNSLLPRGLDLPILKLFKKKIVVTFVGSDIRPKEIEEGKQITNKELLSKKKKVKFWEKYADAIQSDPEYSQLLTRKYYIIPGGYDFEFWKPFISNKFKNNDEVLIVHAPSHREKKGTKYVLEAVELLKKQKHKIKFKLIENLPNSELRELLNLSDIVVDQLLVGNHGLLAVEAMALGKPTLCYLNSDFNKRMEYAKDIPIVNTNPSNIYDNLKLLIDDPKLRRDIGEKSREYVKEIHGPTKIGNQLLKLYLEFTSV